MRLIPGIVVINYRGRTAPHSHCVYRYVYVYTHLNRSVTLKPCDAFQVLPSLATVVAHIVNASIDMYTVLLHLNVSLHFNRSITSNPFYYMQTVLYNRTVLVWRPQQLGRWLGSSSRGSADIPNETPPT